MAEDKPVMVSFINEHGAVHTVEEGLFKDEYKGNVRKLNKATLEKLSKLSEAVAKAAHARNTAVDKDGNPDPEARRKAAMEQQKAAKAEAAFRKSLIEDE